jgi:hypothetical protein
LTASEEITEMFERVAILPRGIFMSRLQRSVASAETYLGLHRPRQQAGRGDSDLGCYMSRLQRSKTMASPSLIPVVERWLRKK